LEAQIPEGRSEAVAASAVVFTIEQALDPFRVGPFLSDGFGQFGTDCLCGARKRQSVELLDQGVDID